MEGWRFHWMRDYVVNVLLSIVPSITKCHIIWLQWLFVSLPVQVTWLVFPLRWYVLNSPGCVALWWHEHRITYQLDWWNSVQTLPVRSRSSTASRVPTSTAASLCPFPFLSRRSPLCCVSSCWPLPSDLKCPTEVNIPKPDSSQMQWFTDVAHWTITIRLLENVYLANTCYADFWKPGLIDLFSFRAINALWYLHISNF